MASETTENYFLLLELNPDAWDQEEFERKLRAKQNQWSRESTGPTKKALLAKKRLELIPEIKRVMSDPVQRKMQAQAAKEEKSSNRDARQEEFARRLRQAETKGFLEQSEVDGFIRDFQNVLNEREIRARIKVEIRNPVADHNLNEDVAEIEPTRMADINANLALLGVTNLYQLLAMPATASCEELYQAAERLFDNLHHQPQKTATISAQTILVGHAKWIFKTEEMRRRYDKSLQYQPLDALLNELAEVVRNTSDKKVYARQSELFVEEAEKEGWKPEAAMRRLRQHAHQQGWQLEDAAAESDKTYISVERPNLGSDDVTLAGNGVPLVEKDPSQVRDDPTLVRNNPIPTGEKIEQEIRCGFCGEMNGRGLSLCQNCQSALTLTCQQCGQSVATDEKNCRSCGFPCIHEVRNLKFQNTSLGLRLNWIWPIDCNEVRVFYSTERWAEPDKKEIQQSVTVTRSEYEALGHYLLRGATQQNYYIVVSLVMYYKGQQTFTPGTRLYVPLTSKMDITYEIKNPRFGYKQRTLHIYTQTPGILPTLLLMTRQGDIPMSKTESTVLHREQGPLSIQREHIIELPDTRFPTKTFGRLFLEDDSLYSVIIIHLPHERKLRLG